MFSDVAKGVPTLGMVPSTGAGCLYPYGIMPTSTFSRAAIEKEVLTTDDLWIAFNNIDNGNRIVKTLDHPATIVNVGKSQQLSLTSINDIGGENQRAIERLLRLFPDTLYKLNNEN